MSDVDIRKAGKAGRITLTRPGRLNALTRTMCLAIDQALEDWAGDDDVEILIIDAEGDRAFCAGGDLAELHAAAKAGDYEIARDFWRDEYRMNRRLFHFPKPVATFLQGLTLGGGVGLGCHGSHRVVAEGSLIGLPEVAVGLVPDVGGSLILARAPGRLGEYLGTTGARIGPEDAIHAGFADYWVPQDEWPGLIARLEKSGDPGLIDNAAMGPGGSALAARAEEINDWFSCDGLLHVVNALEAAEGDFARDTLKALGRASPLSAACTLELVRRVRGLDTIEAALELEYRFTSRALEQGDFLEGIRAAVIDKDGAPNWRHASPRKLPAADVAKMLRPLGGEKLAFDAA